MPAANPARANTWTIAAVSSWSAMGLSSTNIGSALLMAENKSPRAMGLRKAAPETVVVISSGLGIGASATGSRLVICS